MKTLVVFSALVSITVAAPALQGEGSKVTGHARDWHVPLHPSAMKTARRERKSPTELKDGLALNGDMTNSEVQPGGHIITPTGRSFALKKPIIVKKKHGYRLYRDSEEEKNADSHENCDRQVRVKLCDEDGKFRKMLKNSAHDNSHIHTPEEDMRHSIMMAKEAVENLQRDLKKIEHDNAALKMSHDLDSDADLHEDIEVARQALDHIHKNFDNLEAANTQTSARESESMQDTQVPVAKSEEERMAQWKEAIDNIRRNVEIARSIENSFKEAEEQAKLLNTDQSESASEPASQVTPNDEHNLRDVETTHMETRSVEKEDDNEDGMDKPTIENSSEDRAKENPQADDDMNPSASEPIEMKAVPIENHLPLTSENHEKSAEADENTEMMEQAQQDENSESNVDAASPNDAETEKTSAKDANTDDIFNTSENVADADMAPSMDSIQTLNSDALDESQRNTEETESNDESDSHPKSAESVEDSHNEDTSKETQPLVEIGKEAESEEPKTADMKPKVAGQSLVKDTEATKPEQKINEQKLHDMPEPNDSFMKSAQPSNNAPSIQEQKKQQKIDYNESDHSATPTAVKSVEDDNRMTDLASAENRPHHQLTSMKTSEDNGDQLETLPVNTHLDDHHFVPRHKGIPNEFDMHEHVHEHAHQHPHHHVHGPTRYHHDLMPHSNMHDMKNMHGGVMPPKYHPSMRDAEGLGSEHMFSWKPSQDSARSAYGPSLSGSIGAPTGAVGVFPNANTGGCGIPLLLSCSPSVVSGSLAKAHPAGPASYSAPSYRNEEDFTFHNKRDIKKSNDIRNTNILRSPAKQKTEKKIDNKM